MERGRFRWGRRAGHVPADRGADPRNPGHGSDPWPGEPRRRLAQRTHVRWPRLAGRCGLTGAGRPASQGRCAVCGARRTTPTSGPASRPAARAPRAISSRCPVGPGKRPREGRGGGDGGACAAHARPPPRCAAPQSPRGAAVQPPGGGLPRRRVSGRPVIGADDVHALAPDVSGPLSPGPVRFLIPDQNVRRQRTTRSLTPRESAPCQAAPRMPRPWKPMPRRSA